MRPHALIATVLCTLAASAQADVCFTVLDARGKVMHQSRRAPVDMSRPISETLYSRFPGAAVMVFGTNNEACEETTVTRTPPVSMPATGRRALRPM